MMVWNRVRAPMKNPMKSRRTFLTAGASLAGAAAAALSPLEPSLASIPFLEEKSSGASQMPSMLIKRIDTIYWRHSGDAPWNPNWIWVRIATESGHEGIGETYPRNEAEAALVHASVAPILVGRDAGDIDR